MSQVRDEVMLNIILQKLLLCIIINIGIYCNRKGDKFYFVCEWKILIINKFLFGC